MASSSSRLAMPLLCVLAIFMCLAGLGGATDPLEAQEQPLPTILQPQQQNTAELEEKTHEFGDPKPYNNVLRLPSEKDDSSISLEEQPKPNDANPKWIPRFRPFMMPFHSELGKSRYLDQRDLIFRRFPFRSRWPFRFGRPGGCDHRKLRHFLMRRGGYGRRYFPGIKGPDSITLHLDLDGGLGTFHIFPIQPESAGFRPEHRFGPADLEESKPHDSPAITDDVVPEEHVHWVFPKEAVPRSNEEQEEGPVGRWMGWLKSLFHLP